MSSSTQHPPIVPISINKVELNIVYTYDDIEVQKYPAPLPHKYAKLPYVLLNVFMTKNSKFSVFALVDSGCSASMVSSKFVEKFPEYLKQEIQPLNISLGMASSDSTSKITGSIDLLISIKSNPVDKHPLRFVHSFLIGTNLSKDMFLGYDFLGNEKVLVNMQANFMTWFYPPNYQFDTDPYDNTGYKIIPFTHFDADEAAATNNFRFDLAPLEIGMLQCQLMKPMIGETVIVEQLPNSRLYPSSPSSFDHVPQVIKSIEVVDVHNCIPIEVRNMAKAPISFQAHLPIAQVSICQMEGEGEVNVRTPSLRVEMNELEVAMRKYSSNSVVCTEEEEFDNCDGLSVLKSGKMQTCHSEFLNNDPIVAEMPPTLDYEPIPLDVKSKYDFSEEQFLDMFNFEDLDPEFKQQYIDIVLKYREAFAHYPMDIRKCTTYTHDIEVVGTPVIAKQRFLPDNVRSKVEEQVEDYKTVDVMDNVTPRKHFSNFVPIIKPTGAVRLCVDMVFINRNIRSDDKVVLMGSPSHLIHRFHNAKHALTTDLHSAYFHLPIQPNCAQYYGIYSPTSFQESLGFNRVIQGEKTAVYGYNKASNNTYYDMHSFLLNWIDDYCLYAETQEELVTCFEKFCKRTLDSGLSLSPAKLIFGTKKFQFLGEEFDRVKGCRVIPQSKIQGILALKAPITLRALRSFLGVLKFYNGHLPGIAIAALPLQLALRTVKSGKFKWTPEMQQSFIDVKLAMCESVALYDPFPDGIFKLFTDASYFSYAMMLYSVPKEPNQEPPRLVACFSGNFSEQALNYSIYHKELLAVIYAVRKWIPYFYGSRIELYCDNKALIYCAESKSDHVVQYRLAIQLSSLDISFQHCRGPENAADFSSRQWQTLLDRNVTKQFSQKKRSENDIIQIINKLHIKDYYSPEEVKTLLTHNFRVPFDMEKIKECEKQYDDFLSIIPYESRQLKLNTCHDCFIEVSHLDTLYSKLPYSLSIETPTSQSCSYCQVDILNSHVSTASSFSKFGPLSQYEKNYYKGNKLLDFFQYYSSKKLFHYSKSYGYTLQSMENYCSNPQNSLKAIEQYNYYSNSISFPRQIYSSFLLSLPYDIFHRFPVITVNKNRVYDAYEKKCAETCFEQKSSRVEFETYSKPDEIGKYLIQSVNLQKTMRPKESLQNPLEFISPTDRLKATVFKFGFLTLDAFQKAQNDDPFIAKVKKQLQSKPSKLKELTEKAYILIRGILFRKADERLNKFEDDLPYKLYIPAVLVPFILQREHAPPTERFHREGGIMFNNIRQKYYFPHMKELCTDYVKTCRVCAYVIIDKKPPHHYGKTRTVHKPMGHIMIDYAVNMPPSGEGYQHVLVIVCTFTRYHLLIPMKSRNADELLKTFLRVYVPVFGFPERITADNEKSFHQGAFYNYMSKHGVIIKPLMAYRPNSAGMVESGVKRGKHALATFAISMGNRKDWPLFLPLINIGLNNIYHTSIKTSPHHALFCYRRHDHLLDILRMESVEPMPEDPHEYMIQRIRRDVLDRYLMSESDKTFQKNTKHLNKYTIDRQFKLGDKIMRKVHYHSLGPKINRSLMGSFVGPYTVTSMNEYCLYVVDDSDYLSEGDEPVEIIEHKSFCKKFDPNEKDLILTDMLMDEVEKVGREKHRMITRSRQRNDIANENDD